VPAGTLGCMAADDPITTVQDDDRPAQRYDHRLAAEIEDRWQARWREESTFVVPRDAVPGPAGKFFLMDMFPYPSGEMYPSGWPT
jgi:leucyl-tRNA synthetase